MFVCFFGFFFVFLFVCCCFVVVVVFWGGFWWGFFWGVLKHLITKILRQGSIIINYIIQVGLTAKKKTTKKKKKTLSISPLEAKTLNKTIT